MKRAVIVALWALAVVLAACIAWSIPACLPHKIAPTPAQGLQWLDYAKHLDECDTSRDAGTEARQRAFEACVAEKGLAR